MTRMLIGAMAALLLWGPACAQTSTSTPSPLGITSPLGIGPASPVPPAGIPLGATELQSAGVSPASSVTSPLTPSTSGNSTTCTAINSRAGNLSGGSSTGIPSAAPGSLFDGGGIVGTASGTCAAIGTAGGNPAASASSPTGMGSTAVGRLGVPMGSTELGVGGLSPMPQVPILNPTAPSPGLTPTPLLPTPTSGAQSATGLAATSQTPISGAQSATGLTATSQATNPAMPSQ